MSRPCSFANPSPSVGLLPGEQTGGSRCLLECVITTQHCTSPWFLWVIFLIFSLSFRVCHHNSALHSPLISLSHLSYLFPSRCLLECSLQLHPALPLICARHLSYLLSTRCLLECVTTTPRCIHPDFSKSSFLSLILSLPFRVCHQNSALHFPLISLNHLSYLLSSRCLLECVTTTPPCTLSPWYVHVIFLISYLIAVFQSVSLQLHPALPLICARHLSYLLSYRCRLECIITTQRCIHPWFLQVIFLISYLLP